MKRIRRNDSRPPQAASCPGRCGTFDFCGRCVLFVGGRNHHVLQFRQEIEERHGYFAHHDGGVDESMNRLQNLFCRADVILFPVDCVSHAAQSEVKRLCRRWKKPFVPVRRSGIGSFIEALESAARLLTLENYK